MNWNWKFRAVWILCLGVNDMSREMKDSGVEWIGEIPKNWNVQRVKNAFVRKKAEAHQENPVVLSLARAGVKVRDLSKNEGQIAESYYNYNLVEFGDLLLNPMDLYSGANCSISMVEGVISPAYINLRAKSGYSSRFYDYYFKTQYWSNRIHLNVQDCDCVCLFSGGLDSFCGAIRLLEEGGSPCLVGHNEYPKLAKRQNLFVRTFQDLYPEQSVKFISFTANSRAPISEKEGILKGSENTSRGRSLLFLCAALSVAGILGENVPVYIPENGFIGLNIPLTGGRKGTCSTRTTHPYFLRQFNGILEQVGIKNTITNFFAYNTKREIVGQVKDTDAFKSCYADTISCSHPCLARYNKKGSKEYPVNCGYCYPCLIRKSSLLDIDEIKKYSYQGEAYDFLIEYEESEKSADLRAVLGSIYRCKHSSDKELKRYIRCVGELTEEEVEKFLSLYKKSIEDLVQLFSADQRMKEYLGL